MELTLIDVIVIVLALAAAARGWRRGLLGQAFEFGGGFLGLVAGVVFGPRAAAALSPGSDVERALIVLVAVLVGLSIGQVVGFVVGQRFGAFARRLRLGGLDSALGSAFGVVVTLASYWLLGSLLATGPIPALARQLSRSDVLRAMHGVAEPPDVLAYLRTHIDTSVFPQVFAHFPRQISPPVRLPEGALAQRAAEAAGGSTVRVSTPACEGVQLGSGWIAADDTVVTNAHVVAGGDSIEVADADGSEHSGSVVLFDPGIDVAIVRVEGLSGPPLRLRLAALEPGTPGATLGYPGGGGLDARRAAVKERFAAEGRDIYGRATVEREVYELQARVREGNSGGPFVLPGGRVAGVVFAASTADPSTGYALTAAEVAAEIRAGRRAREPVDTGRCAR